MQGPLALFSNSVKAPTETATMLRLCMMLYWFFFTAELYISKHQGF